MKSHLLLLALIWPLIAAHSDSDDLSVFVEEVGDASDIISIDTLPVEVLRSKRQVSEATPSLDSVQEGSGDDYFDLDDDEDIDATNVLTKRPVAPTLLSPSFEGLVTKSMPSTFNQRVEATRSFVSSQFDADAMRSSSIAMHYDVRRYFKKGGLSCNFQSLYFSINFCPAEKAKYLMLRRFFKGKKEGVL